MWAEPPRDGRDPEQGKQGCDQHDEPCRAVLCCQVATRPAISPPMVSSAVAQRAPTAIPITSRTVPAARVGTVWGATSRWPSWPLAASKSNLSLSMTARMSAALPPRRLRTSQQPPFGSYGTAFNYSG